ncbi:hypothetical protein FZEAL_4374 [Fusarium zealandicum]|uniref:non-specific serine/threonine protein kinase n=1 Tax=Fusarium zealandicum TaxID=1053134 RepID=A0A8H4XLI6_9HYPO|nr:hypothetical protein FZEAL_4374 [Fusarium zealandicum]
MGPQHEIHRPQATLPTDIILMIVESLVPREPGPILPASHPTTKSLVALTRVCKATYPTASKLLWKSCLFIDTSQRAQDFLYYLSHSTSWQSYGDASLFLGPFDAEEEYESRINRILEEAAESSCGSGEIANAQDEGLEDDDDDDDWDTVSESEYPSPLNDLVAAQAAHDILVKMAPVLKTLITDMPLSSLDPEDDQLGIRKILRRGFESLVNIEEFVSVCDPLDLETTDLFDTDDDEDTDEEDEENDEDDYDEEQEPEVWATCWPKLRRLALYHADMRFPFWYTMAQAPALETAIFTRPDILSGTLAAYDIKQEWLDAVNAVKTDENATADGTPNKPQRREEIAITVVDCASDVPDFTWWTETWRELDPEDHIQIRTVAIHPAPRLGGRGVDFWAMPAPPSPRDLCQSWIREQALSPFTRYLDRTTTASVQANLLKKVDDARINRELFRRIPWPGRAWKPLTLSNPKFTRIPFEQKIEEETFPDYIASRYYPVHIGQVLRDRYQVVGKLGFGASSTVWLARDLRNRQHVALKLFINSVSMGAQLDNELNMYKRCQIIHTDIKADNIMLGIRDDSVFHDFEQQELLNPCPQKEMEGRTIYTSREVKMPKNLGAPVLCDFGSAVLGDTEQTQDIQPDIYRAPKVILEAPWTYKVDIWNTGCMIWDLFEGGHLFTGHDPEHHTYRSRAHIAEIMAVLGPPPKQLLERGKSSYRFFTDKCEIP